MGLRCLLGHEFGGREVERDRREDGEEVVVAYRTVETCERCGRRRVVSENKEVKPLRTENGETSGSDPEPAPAAGPRADEAQSTRGRAGETRPAGRDPAPDADAPDAAADVGSPPEPAAADASVATESTTAARTTPHADTADAAPSDASDEAAIILDDVPADDGESAAARDATDAGDASADDTPSAAGWPATDDATDDDPHETGGVWPAADGTGDEGFDAETPSPGGPTTETGADPTPWPDEGSVERDRNGTRFVRPEPPEGDVDGETELHCPNCATAHAAGQSSLRPGDVCPDCRKGYLAEREAGRNA